MGAGFVTPASARTLVLLGPFGPLLSTRFPLVFSRAKNTFSSQARALAVLNDRSSRGSSAARPANNMSAVLGPSTASVGSGLEAVLPGLMADTDLGTPSARPAERSSAVADPGPRRRRNDDADLGGSGVYGGRSCTNDPSGFHGNGTCGFENPTGRRVAEAVPIGPDGRLLPSACRNLFQSVCAGVDSATDEKKIEDNNKKLVNDFEAESHTSSFAYSQAMSNVARLPGKFGDLYSQFQHYLVRQVPGLQPAIDNALADFVAAVGKSPLPQQTKDNMTTMVKGLDVRTEPVAGDKESIRLVAEGCKNGLSAGAFSVPSRHELYICPGMVLRAVALGLSLKDAIVHLVSHEVTHQDGADVDPNTKAEGEERAAWMPTGVCLQSKPKFSGQFNLAMLGETAADIMGIRSLIVEARKRNLSPQEAFALTRTALSPLCLTSSDGIHPGGPFRINLLGESDELMAIYGCRVPRGGCI